MIKQHTGRRFFQCLLVVVCSLFSAYTLAQESSPATKATDEVKQAVEKFESAIVAWEKKDKTEVADRTSILFIGSSSIRRWESLPKKNTAWVSGSAVVIRDEVYSLQLIIYHETTLPNLSARARHGGPRSVTRRTRSAAATRSE